MVHFMNRRISFCIVVLLLMVHTLNRRLRSGSTFSIVNLSMIRRYYLLQALSIPIDQSIIWGNKKNNALTSETLDIPDGKYPIIYVDPIWRYILKMEIVALPCHEIREHCSIEEDCLFWSDIAGRCYYEERKNLGYGVAELEEMPLDSKAEPAPSK